jgi:hypothetical protein
MFRIRNINIPPRLVIVSSSNPTTRGQMSMVNEHASEATTAISWRILTVITMLVLATGLTTGLACAETTPVERSESVDLHTGDWLSVSSNRTSLRSVEIIGNLSAVIFPSALRYPADSFNLTSYAEGHYSVRLTFDFPSEYDVIILVKESNEARKEVDSYYFSSGGLLLTVDLDFTALAPTTLGSHAVGWEDFTSWTTRFGDAFPLWVKLLYAVLAIQFVAVGYKWIRFENEARRDKSSMSTFDRGNLLYLWGEVVYKLFLTAFLMIAATMSGQFILLLLLKFMFLAQVKMLSLWDLFVLGFAAGIAAIAYGFKLCLEKSFDLKPLFQD